MPVDWHRLQQHDRAAMEMRVLHAPMQVLWWEQHLHQQSLHVYTSVLLAEMQGMTQGKFFRLEQSSSHTSSTKTSYSEQDGQMLTHLSRQMAACSSQLGRGGFPTRWQVAWKSSLPWLLQC